MDKTRLNITGIGVLNGLGLRRTQYWDELLSGTCGVAPIKGLNASGCRNRLGSQIRGFDPRGCMSPRFYRRLSRLSRLAVAASIEAVLDSALSIGEHNRQRIGCVFGTAFGSTEQTDAFFVSLLDHGPEGAEPFLFPDTVPNALASHVAIFHQIQGPNSTLCQNHLSGECALAYAHSLLESGHADVLVVGGADELSPILLHSLDALGALKAVDPPDERAEGLRKVPSGKGFVPGEAATCLVVERHSASQRHPSKTYGVIEALVLSTTRARQGHYEPDGEALVSAMTAALDEAEVKPHAIDVIGSTLNGIGELDLAEALALEKVFGARWRQIPRFPSRYFTGEFGSAGLLSSATLLLALSEGIVPPHLIGPDPLAPTGLPQTIAASKRVRLRHAIAIGATFGGGAGCLVLSGPRAD
jgi:3-oxoacyl-[acyl-carrier-protein] synthase II